MLGGLGGMEVELETRGCIVGVQSDREMGLGAGVTELYVSTAFIVKPSL